MKYCEIQYIQDILLSRKKKKKKAKKAKLLRAVWAECYYLCKKLKGRALSLLAHDSLSPDRREEAGCSDEIII